MAKSRNNLLGVGGQRKKLSRSDQQGLGQAREADLRTAADHKAELVRKMRERAGNPAPADSATDADTTAQGGTDSSDAQG
ncbi:DUF6243 family protein [Streptomyces sp. NPDC000594]|uniref:DUF6243 family protein n=1 Tax=Streptomyces sp. NPDC000594 TaxID=3154261 RepID=UPI00331DBE26